MQQQPPHPSTNKSPVGLQINSAGPIQCQCPHCGNQIQTRTETGLTVLGWICCLFNWGCCEQCVPGRRVCSNRKKKILMTDLIILQATKHYCPMCNQVIGEYTHRFQ